METGLPCHPHLQLLLLSQRQVCTIHNKQFGVPVGMKTYVQGYVLMSVDLCDLYKHERGNRNNAFYRFSSNSSQLSSAPP
jgi:hypothetical protein